MVYILGMKLTESRYWDAFYPPQEGEAVPAKGSTVKALLRRLLGPRTVEWLSDYNGYLLWNVHLAKALPAAGTPVAGTPTAGTVDNPKLRAVEVGSAPGRFMLQLAERFHCDPFGVENSERGVALNRRLFADHGIDPDQVIDADFLSDDFAERHRGSFDVVLSRGFIEHFTDVDTIVARHVDLLKPGGLLVVSIPSLRGLNGRLAEVFNPGILGVHNLDIMTPEAFAELFEGRGLDTSHCGPFGAFTFQLFNTRAGSWRRWVLTACHGLQLVLNLIYRIVLGQRGSSNRRFSPHLLYVGTRGLAGR